ncbi:MAG: exopolyphosphatase/guanosine-5'-triphosphate,3'-diphosphate pyrophosphatase [Flavobacteriales bacterium]|jgi:exopolyphosphatase/guanosine-5'-triphosphate,3'-diphosphate pyrophosphatase
MRIGIIDCGTNTFNLLIVETLEDEKWKVIFSTKIVVKLAPSAIDNRIGINRYARGIDALLIHRNVLSNFLVSKYFAFATSAIRDSANGSDFIQTAIELLGMPIEVIDGDQEAQLIYEGVNLSMDLGDKPSLIMDIGGGSLEFIICDSKNVYWKTSLPLGVSRLKGKFRPSDPMTADEVDGLDRHIEELLEPLIQACLEHKPIQLIGSSGSFDSLIEVFSHKGELPSTYQEKGGSELDLETFKQFYDQLIESTLNQRLFIKGLVPMRADMIVIALILIRKTLSMTKIESMVHSPFALKEGAVRQVIRQMEGAE